MKKVIAFFLIAVVAMVAVFAADHVSTRDTVQISATRSTYTDIAFYANEGGYSEQSPAPEIEWGVTDGEKTTTYYLYMKSNNTGAFNVKIYATGMTRDGSADDVVPLMIQIGKEPSVSGEYEFNKAAVESVDGDDDGTIKTDKNNYPIEIPNFISAGNGMRNNSTAVTFSADFSDASAGSYYGYVTVVASAAV